MPVHKEGSGWEWGNHGKVYPTKEQAEAQAAAAHANGFREHAAPPSSLPCQVSQTSLKDRSNQK